MNDMARVEGNLDAGFFYEIDGLFKVSLSLAIATAHGCTLSQLAYRQNENLRLGATGYASALRFWFAYRSTGIASGTRESINNDYQR